MSVCSVTDVKGDRRTRRPGSTYSTNVSV